jgi:hypothetical protein
MIKKKTKSKATTKKTENKRGSTRAKREMNAVEVRKKVARVVESKAVEMTKKVIGKLKDPVELATVKYLFEVADIYPPATDGSQSTSEEDSLAKTLLHRLHLPEEPIKHDDDDEPVTVIIPAHSAATAEVDGDEDPGDEGEVEVAGVESN